MSAHKQLSVRLDVLLSYYSDIFKAELGTIVVGQARNDSKILSVPFAIKKLLRGTPQARSCWNHQEAYSQ